MFFIIIIYLQNNLKNKHQQQQHTTNKLGKASNNIMEINQTMFLHDYL
jgi:hypothetical protein